MMDDKLKAELGDVLRAYRDRIEAADRARQEKERGIKELHRQLATVLKTVVRPTLDGIAQELKPDGLRPEVKELDSYPCGPDRGPAVLLQFSTRTRPEVIVILGRSLEGDLSVYRRQSGNTDGVERVASWELSAFSADELERLVVKEISSIIAAVRLQ